MSRENGRIVHHFGKAYLWVEDKGQLRLRPALETIAAVNDALRGFRETLEEMQPDG